MVKTVVNSIVAGVPTKNNRIYSEETLKKIVEEFNKQIAQGRCFVVTEMAPSINLQDITMQITECSYQKDRIEVTVHAINDMGKVTEQLIEKGDFKLVPNVLGVVNGDNTVSVDGVVSFVSFPKDA